MVAQAMESAPRTEGAGETGWGEGESRGCHNEIQCMHE